MSASTGKQPPIAEPRRANFPYERLPLPPPSPLLGWPIFRPLAFVFLLGEQAGSRAINPCPLAPAARAALGTRGAGAALHGGGGELGLGGCQQWIWRAEVKGLDPCILQTGSRKGRCPGIPGRAQAVPPGRAPPDGSACGESGQQKYPGRAGGRTRQSPVFNSVYAPVTLGELFRVS